MQRSPKLISGILAATATAVLGVGFVASRTLRDHGSRESTLQAAWVPDADPWAIRIETGFRGLLETGSREHESLRSTPVARLLPGRPGPGARPESVHVVTLRQLVDAGAGRDRLFVLAPGGERWPVDLEGLLELRVRSILACAVATAPPSAPLTLDEACCLRVYRASPLADPDLAAGSDRLLRGGAPGGQSDRADPDRPR